MKYYEDNIDKFMINEHHQKQHLFNKVIFKCKIKVKDQDELKTYLITNLKCKVIYKRVNGETLYMTDKYNIDKAIKFAFDKINTILDDYKVINIDMDLSNLKL